MFESQDEAIYELLKNQEIVGPVSLEDVRQRALTTGVALASAAVELKLIGQDALLELIAKTLGGEHVAHPPEELPDELLTMLPGHLAHDYGVVPLREQAGTLVLLALDPFEGQITADLGFALGRDVRLAVCDPGRVRRLLRNYYGEEAGRGHESLQEERMDESNPDGRELTVADLEAMAGQAPVIRFVNLVLGQAIRDHASDIHFEPFEHEFKLRYRVDGVLHEMAPPPKALALPIASRVKVLAGLDIAERRVPQDGRIRTTLDGRLVDLRVSTLPTQFGESVVLRVLDQSALQLDLSQLGMSAEVLTGVQEIIRRPNGIFLVTGPTGSGKTTTLYSGLRAINAAELKLLTAEDPVEYDIEGIMQVPVNPAAGLTFASALRTFLRQDPDVIMVGEIRDQETAQIAIQAALTGHLVLSTLHTNDAPTAITRLLDLGVEPFLVATTLEAVLAQRLVRRICPRCRTEAPPRPELLRQVGLTGEDAAGHGLFHGRGCEHCAQTGYHGRLGIYEWLPMTEALRELVTDEAPVLRMQQRAREEGVRSLREDGLRAVFAGETTLEEVLKYT